MNEMTPEQWLARQNVPRPDRIELGLDRVRDVAGRLAITPPPGRVFTVAGTNGKGSCVALLDALLTGAGLRTGTYTSPHLVRYNERIRVDGREAGDAELISAFNAVEQARAGVPLTYFEFGTLAALWHFSRQALDAWILEVGLGGRLDAVNCVDPEIALITTVALDHQAWLGTTVDAIAAEKAGIMRAGRVALFGDVPAPPTLVAHARRIGAVLKRADLDFSFESDGAQWRWRGAGSCLEGLWCADTWTNAQFRNASLVLAALEYSEPGLLEINRVNRALQQRPPRGRFEIVSGNPGWVLDVAHNAQAATVLQDRLARLPAPNALIAVFGLLSDKSARDVAGPLISVVDRWLVCRPDDARAVNAADLAVQLEQLGARCVEACGDPATAMFRAKSIADRGDRVLVTGSFGVVGPALSWLDLYSPD